MKNFATAIKFVTFNTEYRLTRTLNINSWRVERIKGNKIVGIFENMRVLNLEIHESAILIGLDHPFDHIRTSTVTNIDNNMFTAIG